MWKSRLLFSSLLRIVILEGGGGVGVAEQANFHYIVLLSKGPTYLNEFLKHMYLTSEVQPANHDLTLNDFEQLII
jgi:hypothetical protein